MFFTIFFLIHFIASDCTQHLESGVGYQSFRRVFTNQSSSICINISIFPFFIIFGEMPNKMDYYEYRSTNDTKRLDLYRKQTSELLPSYILIPNPFASITIECPSKGAISFTYGSLPGACKTGIMFTNFRNIQVDLSTSLQFEKSLSPNDDKCIIFTAREKQSFLLMFQILGNLLIYENAYKFTSYSGEMSINFSVDASFAPTIFRVLIGNTTKSQSLSIIISNDSPTPFNEFCTFYDPIIHSSNSTCPETKSCNFFVWINYEIVAIIAAFIISSAIVFTALFYVLSVTFCPLFVQKTSYDEMQTETQTSLSPENLVPNKGSEPKGYFAMDPILRPPADTVF